MSMPAMFCHAVFAQYIDSEEVSKEEGYTAVGGALTAREGLEHSQIAYTEAERLDNLTADKGTNTCTTYA